MKRTTYFAPDVQPARPGLYETRFLAYKSLGAPRQQSPELHLWDGKQWNFIKNGVDPRWCQDTSWAWRGLAQPAV